MNVGRGAHVLKIKTSILLISYRHDQEFLFGKKVHFGCDFICEELFGIKHKAPKYAVEKIDALVFGEEALDRRDKCQASCRQHLLHR